MGLRFNLPGCVSRAVVFPETTRCEGLSIGIASYSVRQAFLNPKYPSGATREAQDPAEPSGL